MLKIEVLPNSTTTRTSQKSGKPYTICEGYAYELGKDGKPLPHPTRVEWFLGQEEQPPAPGVYLLAPASLYVGRDGRFAVAPKLVPAPQK